MDRTLQAQLESDPVLRVATEWFFELRSNNVHGERIAEWQQWLSEDPAHRQTFERIESWWRTAEQANSRWPTDAEVAADDYTGAESISAWRQKSLVRKPLGTWRGMFAWLPSLNAVALLGGVCVLTIVSFTMPLYWPRLAAALQGGARFAVDTQVGESRTVPLPDGSLVTVGAHTSLVVTLLKRSRVVVLKRGEAFFGVAKDPTRPFTVEAGSTAVTAIGTAFDVRRNDDRLLIAVAEGTVRVAPSAPNNDSASDSDGSAASPNAADSWVKHLVAGQQMTLEAPDGPHVSPINSKDVAGWREGRLQYLNEPLELVVADISRYSARRIVISDPEVAQIRITSIIFERSIDAWLTSLEATFPIRVVREADGSVRLESR